MLREIQQEFKCPKSQKNSFGNYNYRSLEDILEAVKPILGKLNLSLTISDEVVNVGTRYYVKAVAKLWQDSKVIAENTAYAREAESKKGMDESQITGATSSYARKYCLNGLFAIDDTKDADATNTHDKTETKPEKTGWKPKTKQEQLRDDFTGKNVGWSVLLAKYNVKKISDLSDAQCDEIRKEITNG